MTYIKLIAKPDTWFKAGTEVFWENAVSDEPYEVCTKRRLTPTEWDHLKNPANAGIGCVGIRVTESPAAENAPMSQERWDGEWCAVDEFEAIETEDEV